MFCCSCCSLFLDCFIITDKKDNVKDRRCVYTDGHEEILSMTDLKSLAVFYPPRVTSELAEKQDKEVKSHWIANKRKKGKQSTDGANAGKIDTSIAVNTSDVSQKVGSVSDWQDFDEIGLFEKATEMLPPVEVSMDPRLSICEGKKIHTSNGDQDDGCSSDEEWLTSVAACLLKNTSKASKLSKMQKKNKWISQGREEKDDEGITYKSLADVNQGDRYGHKVVNAKLHENGGRIVGEVSVLL